MFKKLLFCVLTVVVINAKAQFPSPYTVPNTDWIKYFSWMDAVVSAPTALDANSNVYLAGYVGTTATSNLIVLKYDSTGANTYTYMYNNGGYDIAKAIKIDGSGNAIVAGISDGSGGTGYDYVIIKLSPTGSMLWTARWDAGLGGTIDEATDVAILANGDILVTGRSQNSNGDFDIVTLRLDGSSGNTMWGSPHSFNGAGNMDDSGTGIVLSSDGQVVYVTGNTTDPSNGTDIVTYALNTNNGAIYWSPMITNGIGNANDRSNGIILCGGNISICGEIDNTSVGGTSVDGVLIKYDGSNGTILFQREYDAYSGIDRSTALARDSAGNIGVISTVVNGSYYEYHTNLYDSTGTQYALNKETTGLTSLSVDPKICNDTIAHHWYVSGESQRATKDVFVYQMSPSATTSWKHYVDGQNSDVDCATGIAVNGVGVVYVGALSKNSLADYDLTTIKINQTPVYLPVNYNFLTDTFSHSNLFYPQTNEILDTAGNVASQVLYYTKFTYPNQYILKDRVSFCELKEDTSTISPSDTLSRVDMVFLEANTLTNLYPLNFQTNSSINYFLSQTGSGGKVDVKGASHIITPNIYPYIDLFYTSNSVGSKYYFVVKPGGNPENIFLQFQGAASTGLSGGNLQINSELGSWTFMKPKIYNVSLNFMTMALTTPTVTGTNGWVNTFGDTYQFNTGTYNSAFPLVIEFDMGAASSASSSSLNCQWSTYNGGANNDLPLDIKSDAANNVFVVGYTSSNNFPLVSGVNVFQNSNAGSKDGFIDKYDNVGQKIWSTFVGGDQDDAIMGIDFASNGDIYTLGKTASVLSTFGKPSATNYLSPLGGLDLFILQLSSNSVTKKWLTYYGGNGDEDVGKCKFDANGNLFIIGRTEATNIPIVGSSPQYTNTNHDVGGGCAGFIAKYNTSSQITWATYMQSSTVGTLTAAVDGLFDLDFDSNNDLYVVGYANGTDYPNVTNGSSTNYSHHSETMSQASDATISRFSNTGQIKWSTYMGGFDYDSFYSIRVKNNKIYASGYKSNTGYPLVNSGNWFYSSAASGVSDAVLSIWDNSNVLIHSTYLSGNSSYVAFDVQVDNSDVVYVAGQCQSSTFPSPLVQTSNTYIDAYKGADDNFLFAIAPGDTNMVWATDIGGTGSELFPLGGGFIDVNSQNALHITGPTTSSSQFPLFNGIAGTTYFDPTFNSGVDVTITKFYLYPINLIDNIKVTKSDLAEFKVFPNPTQSIINVKLNLKNQQSFYYIYNTAGQLVKQGQFEAESYGIEVSELPQGLYILDIMQNEKKASVKFVKNE